jgi:hypothetical protein
MVTEKIGRELILAEEFTRDSSGKKYLSTFIESSAAHSSFFPFIS